MEPHFDKATHFIAPAVDGRPVPLVVEHATGLPHFAVVADRLVPFEEWAKEQPKPPPGPVRGFSIRAEDASFRGSLEIS